MALLSSIEDFTWAIKDANRRLADAREDLAYDEAEVEAAGGQEVDPRVLENVAYDREVIARIEAELVRFEASRVEAVQRKARWDAMVAEADALWASDPAAAEATFAPFTEFERGVRNAR